MSSDLDSTADSQSDGFLSETQDNWGEFKDHLKNARDDFTIVLEDLNDARQSLEQLVGQVREIPGEIRSGLSTRIQDVTDQLDLGSDS